MKRIFLLFLFLTSLSLAQSQTILDEDFEGETFPPQDWTLINGNEPLGYNWASNSDTNLAYVNSTGKSYPALEGYGSMVYEADATNAKAWAITPAISLTNGYSYTISFYYRVANTDFPEKMKVTVGNDATIQAQNTVLWDNNGGTGLTNETSWTQGTINYIPTASGNFYFGFNCYSDANSVALVVDNIKIEATPTAVPPCAVLTGPANGATNISAPQALFTWDSASTASQYIFKLGTTSSPDSVGFSPGNNTYRSDLAYNTTYYWSIVPKNALGSAVGCPVYSFTTQPAPPAPANDDCAGAIHLNDASSVQSSTRSATQSMPAESCFGTTGEANDDVWFTFTAPQSGSTTLTLTPDLIFDAVINVYSGTCGSLTSLACADQGFDGEPETLTLTNLTAGQIYYVRVYGYGNAGKDGSFTLTASGNTLPVTITSFKGVHNGYENVLSWTTLTEQNNKGFELQSSANGKDFTTLAFIGSKAFNGNSSLPLTYEYRDAKPRNGNSYYRLKQVDKDGRFTTGNIVLLKGSAINNFALSNLYPNPAKSFVNVIITAPTATKVSIIVTDLAGRPVMQQAGQLASGENNISLNINNLPYGSYILKAVSADGNQTSVSKFVKQ
ncbi:T9SS-dependent choice-of-anchor J family protein [Segetibacter koreensis]|uniref:T9SS-dependent choice-of-anchor J family protein n=1 Tax=Segetibacter koreensis TaxID=398037 RepID=UPI00037C9C92|nr:choice-of-anchor J domain-containing protein [Segetibacter koreensis]